MNAREREAAQALIDALWHAQYVLPVERMRVIVAKHQAAPVREILKVQS